MSRMYFISDQHEVNLQTILIRYPKARKDREYATACYILSTPAIFYTVESHMGSFDTPVDWILDFLDWEASYREEWIQVEDDVNKEAKQSNYNAWFDEKPYDLTNSMVQLGRLSLNLWTSYDDFNLMRCLATLDENHTRIARCAIDLRIGFL